MKNVPRFTELRALPAARPNNSTDWTLPTHGLNEFLYYSYLSAWVIYLSAKHAKYSVESLGHT